MVGSKNLGDFLFRATVGQQFSASRHVDAIHIREAHRWRSRREGDLVGSGQTCHLNDFAGCCSTNNRIIDNQYILSSKFSAKGVEFLTYRFLAFCLPWHDERTTHITILVETFPVFQT